MTDMPGYSGQERQISDVDDLLASLENLQIKAVMLDPNLLVGIGPRGGNFIDRGQVLAKVTATGRYGDYDNGAVDGRELTAGAVILAKNIDTTGITDPIQAPCIFVGSLKQSRLVSSALANFLAATDVQRLVVYEDE